MKISLEAPTGATHRQSCRPCRGLLPLNARDRGFTAPAGVVSALSGLSLQSPRDCLTILKGRPHVGNLFWDCSLVSPAARSGTERSTSQPVHDGAAEPRRSE